MGRSTFPRTARYITSAQNRPRGSGLAIAPLLWRLEHYGIQLPKQGLPILKYAERLFSRPAFIEALTPVEKAMRK